MFNNVASDGVVARTGNFRIFNNGPSHVDPSRSTPSSYAPESPLARITTRTHTQSGSSQLNKNSPGSPIKPAHKLYVIGKTTARELFVSLVYVSSAAKLLSQAELLEIVQKARDFNASHGITGMLLHKDGNFMQALEGPRVEVLKLMEKIQHDSRHTGILRLLMRPVKERQFEDWSMGFRDLNTLSSAEMEAFRPYLSASLADEKFLDEPAAAYKLLRFFRESLR